MGNETITIAVQRSSGTFQKYNIPAPRNISILEALYYIWENLDPSLAFSYACRIGVCSACLVQANGKPVLACRTLLEDGMRIALPKGFKAVRDTVGSKENSNIEARIST